MHSSSQITRFAPRTALEHRRSGGAVIIIVLTLLSTMVFLGFFFFGFTDQAQKTAQAYAEAEDYEIDPEPIWDQIHEQLLVGVRYGFEESALWGNKHSILPHIVGPINPNLQPQNDALYSGTGIAIVVYDANSMNPQYDLVMDYNGDGVGDDVDGDSVPDFTAFTVDPSTTPPTYTPGFGFRLNYSRVAQDDRRNDAFNLLPSITNMNPFPVPNYDPAVGYTYPDVNSLFLAYDGYTTISDGTTSTRARVVIPSFFRPQLMLASRDANGSGANGPGLGGYSNAFIDPQTKSSSLRPHMLHLNYNNARRFVQSTTTTAHSGNTNRILRPFPFQVDINLDGVANEMGVFSSADPAGVISQHYEYDFDADNDGVRDAIWMDLGLQMIDLPDGRQVVPLVAIKVLDADALFNLNAHGNAAGAYNADVQSLGTFPGAGAVVSFPVHRSNQGLSPNEVNMSYGMLDNIVDEFEDDNMTVRTPAVLDANASTKTAAAYEALGITQSYLQGQELPAISARGMNRRIMSSAELFQLLTGRFDLSTQSSLAGRYGESNILPMFYDYGTSPTPPRAGRTFLPGNSIYLADDNGDLLTSGRLGYIASHAMVNGLPYPPAIHPLAMHGAGSEYAVLNVPNSGGERDLVNPAFTNPNPSVWVQYGSRWNNHNLPVTNPQSYYQTMPWAAAGGNVGQALQSTAATNLVDEDSEFVVNSDHASSADSPFAVSENAILQLSVPDYALVKESSRVTDLAPFAFQDSPNAAANRQLYGTESWDRREFAPANVAGLRNWEWSPWTAGSSTFYGKAFTATDTHFPPQFGTVAVDAAEDPFRPELRRLLWTGAASDPGEFDFARTRVQNRLNINQFLDGFDSQGRPVYRPLTPHARFYEGEETTPIPAPIAANAGMFPYASITTNTAAVGSPPNGLTGRTAAEWWARYDRQRMARDIYVLLWLTSGGNDFNNYTTTLTPNDPSGTVTEVGTTNGFDIDSFDVSTPAGERRVREMAQFAVNLVDAMDHDDVITRFEYDTNLTDGWQLTGAQSDAVYGIEAQQLAFSEVMLITQPDRANDLSLTFHRDDNLGAAMSADADMAHQFLYIELRNTSPFTVPLETGSWRIVRVPRDQAVGTDDANVKAAVEFRGVTGAMGTRNYKSVEPGGNFVIACHDGTVQSTSGQSVTTFYADIDGGATGLEAVVPKSTTSSVADSSATAPAPIVDLDLNSTDPSHQQFRSLTPYISPTTGGSNYDGTALVGKEARDTDPDQNEFDLVLQRRRNLHSFGAGETYGTGMATGQLWVEVDRFQVRLNYELEIAGDTVGAIVAAFDPPPPMPPPMPPAMPMSEPTRSFERRQPFDPRREPNTDAGAKKHSLNDIADVTTRHAKNFNEIIPGNASQTTFTIWEPHFDRPYSSLMELLSLPLYGYVGNSTDPIDADPRDNTNDPPFLGGAINNLAAWRTTAEEAKLIGHRTAGIRFMYPEPQLPVGTASAAPGLADFQPTSFIHYRNRWHRLLEFLDVPDRADRGIEDSLTRDRRVPGRINLNTLRHERVLAGLIDDPIHLNPIAMLTDTSAATTVTTDQLEARNWFGQLLALRDGGDPILTDAGFVGPLPGNLGAAPFRSPAYTGAGDASINSTILRPYDVGTANGVKRGMFEARTLTDVDNGGTAPENEVDYHTKNRLLAKIHNRTTNRSHVFFVWSGIGFFEAHREAGTAGQVQIGAQADDIPVRRSFMVCDMSRIEEAYEDRDLTEDLNHNGILDPGEDLNGNGILNAIPGTFNFRKFIIYRKLIK